MADNHTYVNLEGLRDECFIEQSRQLVHLRDDGNRGVNRYRYSSRGSDHLCMAVVAPPHGTRPDRADRTGCVCLVRRDKAHRRLANRRWRTARVLNGRTRTSILLSPQPPLVLPQTTDDI